MSNPKPIRIDEKTEQRLSELAVMLDTENFSKLVKKCIEIAHYVGKQKKIDSDFLARLYVRVVVDNSVVDSNVVDHTTLYSNTTVINKKKGEFSENPNVSTESYEQSIHISDRVKDRMPYGEDFESIWVIWRRYLKEKQGNHITSFTEFAQLKELSDLCDESKAIQTIKDSIKNGWTGLFPNRQTSNSGGRKGFTGVDPEEFGAEAQRLFDDLNKGSAPSGNTGNDSTEG